MYRPFPSKPSGSMVIVMKCNGQGFGKSGEYHYLESNHKYAYIVGFNSHIFLPRTFFYI